MARTSKTATVTAPIQAAAPIQVSSIKHLQIGNAFGVTGIIQSLEFGTTKNGFPQCRIVVEDKTGKALYAEAIGRNADALLEFEVGNEINIFTVFEASEYTNANGEVDYYLTHKILKSQSVAAFRAAKPKA